MISNKAHYAPIFQNSTSSDFDSRPRTRKKHKI